MPTADPAAQRRLLDVAATDRAILAANHRRATVPELAVIADAEARADKLNGSLVLARTEVGDLDLATRKLDDEIEQVRARAARDVTRMTDGGIPSKELEGLEHEIASLARRQATLEDQALELMEQREAADAVESGVVAELAVVQVTADAARSRRDDAVADIDDELRRLGGERTALADGLPQDLLAVYGRVRATRKVAAGAGFGPTPARHVGCASTGSRWAS